MSRPDRLSVPVQRKVRFGQHMRIIFLTDKSEPYYVGGYESRVWHFAQYVARQHSVTVFTSVASSQTRSNVRLERAAPIAFLRGKSGGRSLLHSAIFSVCCAKRRLREQGADVLVVEAIPYLHLALCEKWFSDFRGAIILLVDEVWKEYGYGPRLIHKPVRRLIRSLLKRGIGHADLVLTPSRATARTLRETFHCDNVEVLPTGVDFNLAKGDPAEGSKFDFVSVGRLVANKRHHDFLSAIAILKREFDWKGTAAIVGDGPLFKDLRKRAVSLDLEQEVQITGFVSEVRKYDILRSSRVFVLPSEREGLSLATLEALACGLPVIVAKPAYAEVFGVSDIVKDRYNGTIFPVGDVRELASKMAWVASDPSVYSQLSRNAISLARGYDWEILGARFETLAVRVGERVNKS